MPARVAFIHTVAGLVPLFKKLTSELLPEVRPFDIVDETLLSCVRREGRVTTDVAARVMGYVALAEDEGADAVMVTCSSIGPAVDAARSFAARPVMRVDEAMVDSALDAGTVVGALATLESTLDPTGRLIERKAMERGQDVVLRASVVEGAFSALSSGDVSRHDSLVRQGILDLARNVDVIVLAQASMARVLESIEPQELSISVLSSPELAVRRLRDLLEGQVPSCR